MTYVAFQYEVGTEKLIVVGIASQAAQFVGFCMGRQIFLGDLSASVDEVRFVINLVMTYFYHHKFWLALTELPKLQLRKLINNIVAVTMQVEAFLCVVEFKLSFTQIPL